MRSIRRLSPTLGRGARRLALPLLLSAVAACSPAGPQEEPERRAPAVEAVPARSGRLPLEERVSGIVRAANQVAIRPEIEARVVEVMVRNGELVHRGQPLLRLEDRTIDERLRQAEAATSEARAGFLELEAQVVRTRALAEQELVSPLELETLEAQLDGARARVETAEATLEERRAALRETLVRAPVDGRIGRRDAEVGMLVDPATVLFVLGDLGELIVEVPLTEGMLAYVEEGQTVRIGAAALPGPVEASLDRISPFLEEGSFSTSGEIDLPNPEGRLRPGMFVTVDVLYGESEEATLVPVSALWEDPASGTLGLYVVEMEGVAEATGGQSGEPPGELSPEARPVDFRPVEVRAVGRGAAGVAGLAPGEWVVIVGQHLLSRDEASAARVRPASWERVERLQGLQREDLLEGFLAKQQRIARERGVEPPSNEEFLRAPGGGGGGG